MILYVSSPMPPHNGGSVSAKSGAGVAALISPGGTSVRVAARRSPVGPAWAVIGAAQIAASKRSALCGSATVIVREEAVAAAAMELPTASDSHDGAKRSMMPSQRRGAQAHRKRSY